MKILSPTTLAKLTQHLGGEPINIVSISWDGVSITLYADRHFPADGPGGQEVQGKILELANLEVVLNLDKNKSSQAVTIKLDDTDGSVKGIINSNDPHKKYVQIFQWWSDIPFSEKILIFEGRINTPMSWHEGDRTFTFDVLETLELFDVGFSPEEGQIPFIPPDLINKAWPLGFGSPSLVPGTRINEIPTAILLDPIIVPDKSITNKIAENEQKIKDLAALALLYFELALEAGLSELRAKSAKEAKKFAALQRQYEGQGNQYNAQHDQVKTDNEELIKQFAHQGSLVVNPVRVRTKNVFPSGNITIQIGSYLIQGNFLFGPSGLQEAFHFQLVKPAPVLADMPPNVTFPAPITINTPHVLVPPGANTGGINGAVPIVKAGIISLNAGSIMRLQDPYPIYYVVNLLPCFGFVVWAHKTINGLNIITVVPSDWYTVQFIDLTTVQAVTVVFPFALSTRENEWGDEIFVSYTSLVGPNVADILTYIITKYTDHAVDPVSYIIVRDLTLQFPANFALIKRENVIKVVQDICFQANIGVYIKNRTFYFKYLPLAEAAVDTITEYDILVNSLELEYTRTEDIVTKLVGSWKEYYAQDVEYESVVRYNIDLYGRQEQKYDYYIYNSQGLVDKSLTFWAVRKANTWKMLKFKTPLHKLALEIFDTVTINFSTPIVANGPVDCIIESADFDSKESTISFTVWVPVRSGEMVPYLFALPSGLNFSYVFPFEAEIVRQQLNDISSNSKAFGALPGVSLQQAARQGQAPKNLRTRTDGSEQPQGDGVSNLTDNYDGSFLPGPVTRVNPGAAADIIDMNEINKGYDYKKYPDIPPLIIPPDDTPPGAIPGKITGGDGGTYQVLLYPDGKDQDPDPTDPVDVTQLQIADDTTIPEDTWVLVSQTSDGKYSMQVPVWL